VRLPHSWAQGVAALEIGARHAPRMRPPAPIPNVSGRNDAPGCQWEYLRRALPSPVTSPCVTGDGAGLVELRRRNLAAGGRLTSPTSRAVARTLQTRCAARRFRAAAPPVLRRSCQSRHSRPGSRLVTSYDTQLLPSGLLNMAAAKYERPADASRPGGTCTVTSLTARDRWTCVSRNALSRQMRALSMLASPRRPT
jgi:hypothetical protein